MRVLRFTIALAALITGLAGTATAQTATQTVTYEVQAINQISVSGNPSALVVSSATAGGAPTSATNNSTTWAITTNETNKKVTAAINTAMPTGLTLSASLAAPTGATSAGSVALGTTAADLVTGMSKQNQSGMTITYTLDATSAAGVVSSSTKTVTFTVVTGP